MILKSLNNHSSKDFFSRGTPAYWLVLLAVLAGALPAQASIKLEEALPEDTVYFYKIDQLENFEDKYRSHPLQELWSNESVKNFFAPVFGSHNPEAPSFWEAYEKELNATRKEILELVPGSHISAILMPEQESLDENSRIEEFENDADSSEDNTRRNVNGGQLRMLDLFECNGDRDTLEAMIRASAEHDASEEGNQHHLTEEIFEGEKLYLEEIEDDKGVRFAGGYALVGKILIITNSNSVLRDTVLRLKEPDRPSLDEGRGLQYYDAFGYQEDLMIYFNLNPMVRMLQSGMSQSAAAGAGNPGPMGSSMASLVQDFELSVLEGLYFRIYFDEDRNETALSSGLLYEDKRGVLSLLSFKTAALPDLAFLPEDLVSVQISGFSVAEFWIHVEDLIIRRNPMLSAYYDSSLLKLKQEEGVDLHSGLIENLDDQIIMAVGAPEGQKKLTEASQDVLYAIKIKDKAALELLLQALKDSAFPGADPFETSPFLDFTINVFSMPGQQGGMDGGLSTFSYCVTNDYLFVVAGRVTFLEQVLSLYSDPGGNSIWETDPAAYLLEELEDEAVAWTYQDLDKGIVLVFQTFGFLQNQLLRAGLNYQFCDMGSIPEEVEFPYILLMQTVEDSNGFHRNGFLVPKENK